MATTQGYGSLRLAVDNTRTGTDEMAKIAQRWIDTALAQLRTARRGGNPSSIAAAKATLADVRRAVRSIAPVKPTIIHCVRHGCRFSAVAMREGLAVRELAAHLVVAHPQDVNATEQETA